MKKPSMDDRIQALIDEWDSIYYDLHELCEVDRDSMPSFITYMIVEPLDSYLADENKKKGFSDSVNSGLFLLYLSRSVVKGITENPDTECVEYVWQINEAWQRWYKDISAVLKTRATPFLEAGKNRRTDSLSQVMLDTFKDFCDTNGREPKTHELWEALPEGKHIQEKDPEEKVIYYRKKNGKETSTSYKSFQNRFTKIKKNLH